MHINNSDSRKISFIDMANNGFIFPDPYPLAERYNGFFHFWFSILILTNGAAS